MSSKNLPKRSKIILILVGFLVTIYLLIVGFSYIKSWNDFKPYHKLAIELNATLSKGYVLTETKNCGLEGPACPSAELNKTTGLDSIAASKAELDKVIRFEKNHDFSNVKVHDCTGQGEKIYCTADAASKDNLLVETVITPSRVTVSIRKNE